MSRVLTAFLALAIAIAASSALAAERGLPLIAVTPAEVHKGGSQNFEIAQDAGGVLYFGNLRGVLTYDGAWWRTIDLPNDSAAFALTADPAGRIVLGGVGDIGHLAPDGEGSLRFRSLLPQLPRKQREFGDVYAVCRAGRGVVFLTDRRLLFWDGGTPRGFLEVTAESAPRDCIESNGIVYLATPDGVRELDAHTLQPLPHHHFAGRPVDVVIDGGPHAIAFLHDQGLFTINGATAAPFAPEVSRWLKDKNVTGGCRLHDGRLVITTREDGMVMMSADGKLEQIIDVDAGLPEEVMSAAYADRDGSLWLAMHPSIGRIDVGSTVSLFDRRRGVRGGINDVARFDGRLFTATSHGLFAFDREGNQAQRVAGIPAATWQMLIAEGELLVGTSNGVHVVRADGSSSRVPGTERLVAYALVPSPSNPSRVWIGMRTGLGVLRRAGSEWRYDGLVPNVKPYVRTMIEREGALWCGTVFDGVVRVNDLEARAPRTRLFGAGEINVYEVGGRLLFLEASGKILELRGDELVPDGLLGHLAPPGGFFLLDEDRHGNVWVNSLPPRLYRRRANGTFDPEGEPLVSIGVTDIQFIRADDEGLVWIGADRGLFRYEPPAEQQRFAQPVPLIRTIVAGENQRRLRIEFAPASYRPGVAYQYRLDPLDADWSAWTADPFIDYTNLGPGQYTFRLRARGPAAVVSKEARWSFRVQPPWYRTPWAFALGALLVIALVLSIVRLRTRALRAQAARLRAVVADRTRELELANARLEQLSLVDDLTGVANRRYFQRALADEWERGTRREEPLALILLDLDQFKELNDSRGHPAGDDCLRQVGAFLAERFRPTDDVVARYGGEEFAILLPGVDLAEALRVAETLREGIERLSIFHGTTTPRRLTASCGVAALVPSEDLPMDTLIDRADRALYDAKHSGRNCVRFAA